MAAPFSPAQPASGKLGAVDPVERWGQLTLEGNLALERGEDVKARQSYAEALAVVEEMMVAAARAHDARAARFAPALYGIACNNIIELARQQGDGLTAGIFLCKAAAGFLCVMECAEAAFSLRYRCLLHSRYASTALCRYFEESGMWDAAETYTARANAAFFSLQRLEQSDGARSQSTWLTPDDALPFSSSEPPTSIQREAELLPPPLAPERESLLLPATVWSDAQPALDLSPPRAPIQKALGARLLEWAARAFRRSPRSTLPPLGSPSS